MPDSKTTTPTGATAGNRHSRAAPGASLPPGMAVVEADSNPTAPWAVAGTTPQQAATKSTPKVPPKYELLLVCLQDPFDGIGAFSSKIVDAYIPACDQDSSHQWRLRSVLEMHPSRFFESWATRGSFTLDLTVQASVSESAGQWGGSVNTFTGTGSCRVMIMRDADNKIRMSLVSEALHAMEKQMPKPDAKRFLNADVGFEVNGTNGLTAGALAVISNKNWSRLIAGLQSLPKV